MITFGGHLVCDRCGTPGPSFINEWDYTWRCSECGYISAILNHLRPERQQSAPRYASGGSSGGGSSGGVGDLGRLAFRVLLFVFFLCVIFNWLKDI